jgi:3-methylfumaryl-CoA hydratase
MALDLKYLQKWIGNAEEAEEELDLWPVTAMMAILDVPAEDRLERGDTLPPTAHWNYFVPRVPESRVDRDGHPQRGDFLPPIPLPRRMWAGSRIEYYNPLVIGQKVSKSSTVQDIKVKEGKSGSLAFVTVRHTYSNVDGIALVEEQDLVYRDNPPTATGVPERKPSPVGAVWSQEIHPDTPMLFRYSAVTFNAHKIHYDYPYATEVEGYPALIVHGQLIATFLLDNWQRNNSSNTVTRFSFRAMSPLFCGEAFKAEGKPAESGNEGELWACTTSGGLTMQANVAWK